jgi:hypothetical protein
LSSGVYKKCLEIIPDLDTRATIYTYNYRFLKCWFNIKVSFLSKQCDTLMINSLMGSRDDFLSYLFLRPRCRLFLIDALYGDPYVNNVHKIRYGFFLRPFFRIISKRFYKSASLIIFHSKIILDKMQHRFPEKKMMFFPFSVYKEQQTYYQPLHQSLNPFIFTIAGMVHEYRRDYMFFLDSVDRFCKENPSLVHQVKFVILGSSTYQRRYYESVLERSKQINFQYGDVIQYYDDYVCDKEYQTICSVTDVFINPINLSFYTVDIVCTGIGEAVKYAKPSLFPNGYDVLSELETSVDYFQSCNDLVKLLKKYVVDEDYRNILQNNALKNSKKLSINNYMDPVYELLFD